MYKHILGIVALVFSLALCNVAFADCQGMKKMVESLKLDDAQKTKIKPVLEQLKTTALSMETQMMDVNKQIHEQEMSATMDQSTVDGLVDKKVKMIGDMIKAKVMAKSQILAVLNDAQKTQLQSMMKAKEDKMAAKFKSCHDED